MKTALIPHLVSWVVLALFSNPLAAELRTGDNAPTFELLDQYSEVPQLSDYRGR